MTIIDAYTNFPKFPLFCVTLTFKMKLTNSNLQALSPYTRFLYFVPNILAWII